MNPARHGGDGRREFLDRLGDQEPQPGRRIRWNEPAITYSAEPRYDLGTSGMALVKTCSSGHGTTCPGMA